MSTQFTNRQWRLPNNENKDKQSNYSMDKFDQNDYISTPLTIDEFSSATMSIWFKTSLSQNDKYFLTFPETSGSNGFDLNFVTSGIKSYLVCHSGASTLNSTFTYNDGNWHHVIVSYSGTIHKMYIDGVLTDSNSASIGTIKNAEGNLYIGALSSLYPTYRVSQTKLDQVVVFNYALSDGGVSVGQTATGQIATLYGGGSAIGNPMSLSPKPVFYAPLGDQDSFNGADYLVPNSSLKDYVFSFDGSNDYVSALGVTNLNGLNTMSFSLWVKAASGAQADSYSTILTIADSTTNQGQIIFSQNNTSNNFNFYVRTSAGYGTPATTGTGFLNGNWRHVVGTYDGTNLKLYLDGAQVSNVSRTGNLITATGELYIAKSYSGLFNFFNGSLSNVQVFNTALPATGSNSVETLYNNGSPLTSMSGFTSLQGWWKLDASATYDSSTTTWSIPDDSSNSNTGTSSGMTQANLIQSDLSFTSGYSPYALDFDGTDDYISAGRVLAAENTSALSVSFWLKIPSIGAKSYLGYFIGNFGAGWLIEGGATSIGFALGDTTTGYQSFTLPYSGNIIINTWYHITMVFDGTQTGSANILKVYINGTQKTLSGTPSFPSSIPTLDATAEFTIGGIKPSTVNGAKTLSNVSIWNTALTSTQVTEIYSEGIPQNLNNHSAYSNLVSWWQLGSNSSFNTNWTVLDEKGTNNGTSVNMIESDIVDGVNSYANGLSSSMGGDEVIGSAPFSDANSLSVNMDVLDRVEDTPS